MPNRAVLNRVRVGSGRAGPFGHLYRPLIGELGGVNEKRYLSSVGLAICSMAS